MRAQYSYSVVCMLMLVPVSCVVGGDLLLRVLNLYTLARALIVTCLHAQNVHVRCTERKLSVYPGSSVDVSFIELIDKF